MFPTLYDILGVPADASADEIKRAWRDAADRFEPGSGASGAQFRLFNEAAAVLLDPAKRAEYDASLASGDAPVAPVVPASATEPAAEQADEPSPVSLEKSAGPEAAEVAVPTPVAPDDTPEAEVGSTDEVTTGGPSDLTLIALGIGTLVLVVVTAFCGLVWWSYPDVRSQDQVDAAEQEAPAAAERAAATILSYDYTTLDTDEKAAERYMTPAYAKEYANTFDKLVRPNAPKLRAKVQASVRSSGVANATADRVQVLLFVNQSTSSTATGTSPQTALNRVQMTMVDRNGTWLVDHITSY